MSDNESIVWFAFIVMFFVVVLVVMLVLIRSNIDNHHIDACRHLATANLQLACIKTGA